MLTSNPALTAQIGAVPQLHDDDNPLWTGPCGTGPNGGITQSMLSRFLSCRERFRLWYVCGLEPHRRWNHRLGYGSMWHACEEGWSRNGEWDTALEAHTRAALRQYPLQQEEILKWHQICAVQFPEYVCYWQDHPDVLNRKPLMQEQVFDVPYTLPSARTVRLRGKWDSVDLIDGGVWLQENKTKGDVDKVQIERQLTFDLQTMTYLVALGIETQNLGEASVKTYPPICGVRYNVVRRPLSGGKGTIRPHTATRSKPAETDEQFYERLRRDYIAAEPDYWFFRVRVGITAHDIEVFRKSCLEPLLDTVCWWYSEVTAQRPGVGYPLMNYRTPFGVYSALEEGGSTEYDGYLATGSEVGLRRTESLFEELQ